MQDQASTILVTGCAGFIGSALARALVAQGYRVVGLDNYDPYYDVALKRARVAALIPDVPITEVDVTDRDALEQLFSEHQFTAVCHLAANAGVRYSIEAPNAHVHANIDGTVTLLEVMKNAGVSQMVFASTSSVYGNDSDAQFREDAPADRPMSVYGASKRSAELMLHTYHALFGIEATCLRFFTVYGPWSRPDMAMLKFAKMMAAGETIPVYNHGQLERDFTYIDDIVDGFVRALQHPHGYEIINLGGGQPVALLDYIAALEAALGIEAKKELLPMQPGDVYRTAADITKARTLLGYEPQTDLATGVRAFAQWFTTTYGAIRN